MLPNVPLAYMHHLVDSTGLVIILPQGKCSLTARSCEWLRDRGIALLRSSVSSLLATASQDEVRCPGGVVQGAAYWAVHCGRLEIRPPRRPAVSHAAAQNNSGVVPAARVRGKAVTLPDRMVVDAAFRACTRQRRAGIVRPTALSARSVGLTCALGEERCSLP
jgi:hypothetical protein